MLQENYIQINYSLKIIAILQKNLQGLLQRPIKFRQALDQLLFSWYPESSIGFVYIHWDKDIFIHFLLALLNFLEISNEKNNLA